MQFQKLFSFFRYLAAVIDSIAGFVLSVFSSLFIGSKLRDKYTSKYSTCKYKIPYKLKYSHNIPFVKNDPILYDYI